MGPDEGAAPCSAERPLESRMLRRRLTSSSYLFAVISEMNERCQYAMLMLNSFCLLGLSVLMYLLLDDLCVTLFEFVKVILHHVDFAHLLRDCVWQLQK